MLNNKDSFLIRAHASIIERELCRIESYSCFAKRNSTVMVIITLKIL